MPEQLFFTRLLNQVFGGPLSAILNAIGVHAFDPAHPSPYTYTPGAPINDAFALELMVALGLVAFFLIVRVTLSVEKPAQAQHLAEMIHEFVGGNADQIIGHNYERFQSWVTVIFLFVAGCNLIGLIPGWETPTAHPSVPLGIALLTFLYYNFYGLKEQGVWGYTKHFMGPIPWIAPLLFPIEIVSHLARIMSLTIRLYANMFASDLLLLVFFSMVPFVVPVVFLGLHFGVALIQAYVFMMLAMIYLSQAVAHEH